MSGTIRNAIARTLTRIENFLRANAVCFFFLLGLGLLFLASPQKAAAFESERYKEICANILDMLARKGFGALLTTIAGIGAIVASVMGGFRMAWACVVVSVGSFILEGYIPLFFKSCK